MKTSAVSRVAQIVALVAAVAGLSGCVDYSKIEISKHYPVGNSPSPECLDAARRATYWCERGVPRSDPDTQGKCLKAQWDHARAC
jgi:hypothetical protein